MSTYQESDKMEPSLIRMSLSDPLSCLVGMDAVGKINSLDREREKKSKYLLFQSNYIPLY